MRLFIKKLTALSTVAVLLSLNISYSAFAITSTKTADISTMAPSPADFYTPYDSVFNESNGEIYVVALEMPVDNTDLADLRVLKYTPGTPYESGSWSTATVLKADHSTYNGQDGNDTLYIDAKIKLNSSGYPVVVWQEVDHNTNGEEDASFGVYYKQFNGSSWDATRTVDSDSIEEDGLTTGTVAFDIYPGTDVPTVFSCNSSEGSGIYQYRTTDQFASNTTAVQVTGDSSCSSVDVVIDSDPDIYLAAMDNRDGGDEVDVYLNPDSTSAAQGSWSSDANGVITNANVINEGYVRIASAGSGVVYVAALNESETANQDSIIFAERNSGTWEPQVSVATGLDNTEFDLAVDAGNNDNAYIAFADGAGHLQIAYGKSSFTSETVNDFGYDDDSAKSNVVLEYNSYGSLGQMEVVAIVTGDLNENLAGELDHYSVTSLPSSGGGGGGAVPEFSTYVYVATIMALFGMMYKKNPEAFGFVGVQK